MQQPVLQRGWAVSRDGVPARPAEAGDRPGRDVVPLAADGHVRGGDLDGDGRSVKIASLEAAKIMKIKWLVLGCIEADFCN